MTMPPETIARIRERCNEITIAVGNDVSVERVANATGLSAETVYRLQEGIAAFDRPPVIGSGGSVFKDAVSGMEEAELKGFCLQWYKAMGGDADAGELAMLDSEALRELAERQAAVFAQQLKQTVCEDGSSLRANAEGSLCHNLIAAAVIYADFIEDFKDFPEIVGLSLASQSYIAEKIALGHDADCAFIETLLRLLGILVAFSAAIAAAAMLAAVAAVVCMAVSGCTIGKLIALALCVGISAVAALLIVPKLIEESEALGAFDMAAHRRNNRFA